VGPKTTWRGSLYVPVTRGSHNTVPSTVWNEVRDTETQRHKHHIWFKLADNWSLNQLIDRISNSGLRVNDVTPNVNCLHETRSAVQGPAAEREDSISTIDAWPGRAGVHKLANSSVRALQPCPNTWALLAGKWWSSPQGTRPLTRAWVSNIAMVIRPFLRDGTQTRSLCFSPCHDRYSCVNAVLFGVRGVNILNLLYGARCVSSSDAINAECGGFPWAAEWNKSHPAYHICSCALSHDIVMFSNIFWYRHYNIFSDTTTIQYFLRSSSSST
jgi:hypothetical protein